MLGKSYVDFNCQESCLTKMFSYVISLLANLNARGQSNSEIHMNDISTPQIAVTSLAQQQITEGGSLPTLLQASSIVAPGISVDNIVQLEAPIVKAAESLPSKLVSSPLQSGMMENSACV
jgi:hypothetical protein